MDSLRIGQVAKAARVNVETVRYYERRGLLPEPARRSSGYRAYAPDAVRRIQFIRQAQQLGFSLQEVDDLLRLRVDPERSCSEVRHRAEAKIADIERKIADMRSMQQALATLSENCHGDGQTGECPFLDAIDLQVRDCVEAG